MLTGAGGWGLGAVVDFSAVPSRLTRPHTSVSTTLIPSPFASNRNMQSFKDLIVWQRSIDLATIVYELTETFPATARFGLARQMDDAAISISSNIAEGYSRSSQREWLQFLDRSAGSLNEL